MPTGKGRRIKNSLLVFVIFLILTVAASCAMFDDIDALKKLRYEAGHQKGAGFCASCHEDIYNQWSKRSRHSLATTSPSFHHTIRAYSENIVVGLFMDEGMCYSCHGSKDVNEGVNCETCHGTVLRGVPIEKTHADKFTPRLSKLREPDFCASCHQSKTPVSGDDLSSTYTDWRASKAAAEGVTCQGCHMGKRQDDTHAYHGFDTAVRDETIYRGLLAVGGIRYNHPELRLTIENRIKGHSVPAGGPTRVLALELSFRDSSGTELFAKRQTFSKRFSLIPIVGAVPYRLIENTQLRSGEKRSLRVTLPSDVRKRPQRLVIVLRMYEVSDEYEGDIGKAHWASKPILRKEVDL